MLEIIVPGEELYDEKTCEFTYTEPVKLVLEHSLVSVSKWESKWHKPFISKNKDNNTRTREESIDYVRCMTITQNVKPEVYTRISEENLKEIAAYIDDSHTATWFGKNPNEQRGPRSNKETTSELIYFWMINYNIPIECQKWHLNRLMTLIKVCNEENAPRKEKSKRDVIANHRALNAKRRAKARK